MWRHVWCHSRRICNRHSRISVLGRKKTWLFVSCFSIPVWKRRRVTVLILLIVTRFGRNGAINHEFTVYHDIIKFVSFFKCRSSVLFVLLGRKNGGWKGRILILWSQLHIMSCYQCYRHIFFVWLMLNFHDIRDIRDDFVFLLLNGINRVNAITLHDVCLHVGDFTCLMSRMFHLSPQQSQVTLYLLRFSLLDCWGLTAHMMTKTKRCFRVKYTPFEKRILMQCKHVTL